VNKKLYVGNFPFTLGEQDLGDMFAEVGQVESARIVIDRETGRSKGFGFVEMANEEDAALAISKLNGAMINGRALTVNEARPQENTGGARGGRREGGNGGGGRRDFRGGSGGGGNGGGGRGRF